MRTMLLSAISAFVSLSMVLAPATRASDYTSPHRHIDSIHEKSDYEDFCVDNSGTTRSWSTAMNNIEKALYLEAPNDREWDSTSYDPIANGYRVFFLPHKNSHCDGLPYSERLPIEIEYHLWDNTGTNPPDCGHPSSCIGTWEGAYVGSRGHTEYTAVYVHLYAGYTVGELGTYYRHQVNHETGHVLGFKDGTCPPSGSIMHTPPRAGCTYPEPEWPSTGDKSALGQLAP